MKKYRINTIQEYPIVNKVWVKLLRELPKYYHNMHFAIAPHDVSHYELTKGGWATPGTITVGSKFLNEYKQDAYTLATMLAHELGHHVLGHIHCYKDSFFQEWDADCFGLHLAMKAGFSAKKYVQKSYEYDLWRSKGIQQSHVKSHGTAEERNENLKNQLKYLGIK